MKILGYRVTVMWGPLIGLIALGIVLVLLSGCSDLTSGQQQAIDTCKAQNGAVQVHQHDGSEDITCTWPSQP